MLNQFADYALRVNLKGIASLSIPAGQTASHEFQVPSEMILTGAEYFRSGGNLSDTVSFKIKQNGQTMAVFADEIFVGDKARYEFYQATLNQSHVIEVVYKNTGSEAAEFCFNLITHLHRSS